MEVRVSELNKKKIPQGFAWGYSATFVPSQKEKKLFVKKYRFLFYNRDSVSNEKGSFIWWKGDNSVYCCNLKWLDEAITEMKCQKKTEWTMEWRKPIAKSVGLVILAIFLIFLGLVLLNCASQPLLARLISGLIAFAGAAITVWCSILLRVRGYLTFD